MNLLFRYVVAVMVAILKQDGAVPGKIRNEIGAFFITFCVLQIIIMEP